MRTRPSQLVDFLIYYGIGIFIVLSLIASLNRWLYMSVCLTKEHLIIKSIFPFAKLIEKKSIVSIGRVEKGCAFYIILEGNKMIKFEEYNNCLMKKHVGRWFKRA